MKLGGDLVVAAALVLTTGAATAAAPPPARPQRIFTANVCLDQLALALVPKSRIASITYVSLDYRAELPPGALEGLTINHGQAEEVLAQKPDLILASPYSAVPLQRLAQRAGSRVVVVKNADSFQDVRDITLQVGEAVGEPVRARALVAHMDAVLADLAAHAPPRRRTVVAWSGAAYVPGQGTMANAVIEAAGAQNIAARPGVNPSDFGVEELLKHRPEALIVGAGRGAGPLREDDKAADPTLRRLYAGRRITHPDLYYTCGLPGSADAAVALREALAAVPPGAPRLDHDRPEAKQTQPR